MSKQVTFTRNATDVVVTCIAGTLEYGGDHDDRGGSDTPQARAGIGKGGKCQVVITDTNADSIMGLVSPVGSGDYTVGAGVDDDIPAAEAAYDALVDVEMAGDGVQVATITWKGTKAAA